jgi:hypothetical protein
MLSGWRLHHRAVWVLLALNLGVPMSSWLPGDWAVTRAMLQVVGCLAGGMLLASAGALWQRVDASVSEPDMPNDGARVALSGWRHHPQAARVLLVLLVGGVTALTLLPHTWVVLRGAALVLGTFAAGALAAREAAIWERTPVKAAAQEAGPGSE